MYNVHLISTVTNLSNSFDNFTQERLLLTCEQLQMTFITTEIFNDNNNNCCAKDPQKKNLCKILRLKFYLHINRHKIHDMCMLSSQNVSTDILLLLHKIVGEKKTTLRIFRHL